MGKFLKTIQNAFSIISNGKLVDVNNPLPTDGDSVYEKDLDLVNSDIDTFTGDIESLFNSTQNEISDASPTNPKTFTLVFLRPVSTSQIGIASKTGDFSNVVLKFNTVSGDTRYTIDDSADNTKHTSQLYVSPTITFDTLVVEFHTVDAVDIAGMTIPKTVRTTSQLQALDYNGLLRDVGATTKGDLHVLNHSFSLAVAEGLVPGHSLVEKYGRNDDIGTSSAPEDVWNGGATYTGFPTGAAETMEIVSDNVADVNISGTGAWTATIYNLQDEDGNAMPDIAVNLNGTTPVSLGAQTYYRGGTRIKINTAGSAGGNVGQITLRHTTTTTNIFAVMPANRNQTAIAAYTVPLGFTFEITFIKMQLSRASGAAGSANMTFRSREHGKVFNSNPSPEITNSSPFNFSEEGFYSFPERTDIKCRCESVSDNKTIITAQFGGYLIEN